MGLQRIANLNKLGTLLLMVMLALFAAGCKKKVPPPTPTPPPPPPPKAEVVKPAAPRVSSFEAEPSTVERGQAVTLRWSVAGEATEVRIEPGIGSINASGSRQVFPGNTTTYTLTATGPGGSNSATATVNVTAPPPAAAPPPRVTRSLTEWLAQEVQDVYFDYDSSTIREDARAVLSRNAEALKGIFAEHRDASISVEGHADERGSAEYNLGLADRRATAAKEFLVQLGVPEARLKPVSYGKERPQCTEGNEGCWQRNRRAHFSVGQ